MNKISIALCTFNGERFLQEQLDSLAAQTRLPDEVVVGDDGSTDRTLEILEAWAKTVPFPVRIQINERTLGPAKNFETTILRCSGDVIFMCDQDDVWLPEKIEHMTNIFDLHQDTDLVYCNADTIDQNGNSLDIPRVKISLPHLICSGVIFRAPTWKKNYHIIGCCGAVRRTRLKDVFPIPGDYGHDMTLYLRVPAFAKIRTINKNLIHYRLHRNNTSLLEDWRTQMNKNLEMAKRAYRWLPGVYFLLEQEIQDFLDWIRAQPESKYRAQCIRYVHGNQLHYPNRLRIQRNAVIFFPQWLLELFSGRYFQRLQPVRSIFYDLAVGLWNAANPWKSAQEIRNLMRKIFRKK
ncbi:MAG: glycosyltransferase [Thermoguttaceae bacterium]|nr:glycosyltransferase [Thermoguttaceae bacterium]